MREGEPSGIKRKEVEGGLVWPWVTYKRQEVQVYNKYADGQGGVVLMVDDHEATRRVLYGYYSDEAFMVRLSEVIS